MAKTKIEWATDVWNPVTGCTPVSEGCESCYARRMAYRLKGRCGYPILEPFRVRVHHDRLEEPYRWRKPRLIFVCSMSDLFHDEVPDDFILRVFEVISDNPEHVFMVLTKRPCRMKEFCERLGWKELSSEEDWWPTEAVLDGTGQKYFLPNLWLGITVENQARAEERIPILLQIPAAVHFVSYEPALGPIDLTRYLRIIHEDELGFENPDQSIPEALGIPFHDPWVRGLDWVIAGGETGPGARPAHPDWFRQVRDQCKVRGVPFFFKGWGDWWPAHPVYGDTDPHDRCEDIMSHPNNGEWARVGVCIENGGDVPEGVYRGNYWCHNQPAPGANPWWMWKVGKKRAGRSLDGRTWDEFPAEAHHDHREA